MNSAPSGPTDPDNEQGRDRIRQLSVGKLEAYKEERLAGTETPTKPAAPKAPEQKSALLKARYYWVLSRS